MNMLRSDRVFDEAVSAASAMAQRLTGTPVMPTVLHYGRRVAVLLDPIQTVARVACLTHPGAVDALKREIDVARHLVARGAPAVGPSSVFPAGPHIHYGFAMTFWPYIEHLPAHDDNDALALSAAKALRQVHDALVDFPDPLPSYIDKIRDCGALLMNSSVLPELAALDREWLLNHYLELTSTLGQRQISQVPIHGDAHLGNVLFSAEGPLWTDFEAVCMGPLEWDMCWMEDVSVFEPLDHELLELLSALRSICISVWCGERPDLPGKREAALHHLEELKRRYRT
jgi:Phosphotransferase enzyme family